MRIDGDRIVAEVTGLEPYAIVKGRQELLGLARKATTRLTATAIACQTTTTR